MICWKSCLSIRRSVPSWPHSPGVPLESLGGQYLDSFKNVGCIRLFEFSTDRIDLSGLIRKGRGIGAANIKSGIEWRCNWCYSQGWRAGRCFCWATKEGKEVVINKCTCIPFPNILRLRKAVKGGWAVFTTTRWLPFNYACSVDGAFSYAEIFELANLA